MSLTHLATFPVRSAPKTVFNPYRYCIGVQNPKLYHDSDLVSLDIKIQNGWVLKVW